MTSPMESDDDAVWCACAALGGSLLPLVDQEPWRQARRREEFGERGLGVRRGELLTGAFAALLLHALVADAHAAGSPHDLGTLHAIPLRAVVRALHDKWDYEILAGSPKRFRDDTEETAVAALRLLAYQVGPECFWFTYVGTYVRRALTTLIDRSRMPSPTCGDLRQWAGGAGLLP
ncbi:hypothetical protein ACWDQO_21025 [Streptomyces sp. NPDC003703]|uniref:hypothetical protein n=1 Tax=Streptomyces sp. NPDC003283 TaxID=3364681 RepID=UPI0036C3FD70